MTKSDRLCLHFMQTSAYKYLTVKCHILNVTVDYLADYIN